MLAQSLPLGGKASYTRYGCTLAARPADPIEILAKVDQIPFAVIGV